MNSLTLETPEMLYAILSSIDEGIHVIDSNGYTIYYNQVIAALDGLTKEEVIGQHILDVFPSLNRHTSTLLRVIEKGQPLMNQPQSYVNIKGRRVDTVNSTLPIFVQDRLVGAVEVAKDVSKIRQMAEHLLDLQAQVTTQPMRKVPKNRHSDLFTLDDYLTNDPAMLELKKSLLKVAQTNSPVLIYGETGTGKEIMVQSLHTASPRSQGPFIAQNCAALPANLLESLLFGTTKGSFTGSMDRKGLFELANGGTLFLDEINSMPIELQAKLLRVLQDGKIRRIGDHRTIPVDVRIVVAMNVDPLEAVKMGKLRSDLYYRIQVVSFYLTPLRNRMNDLPLLAEHFIASYAREFGKPAVRLDPKVLQYMLNYDWQGNIRELKHAIEAAMNMAEDTLLCLEHFPEHLQNQWRSMKREQEQNQLELQRSVSASAEKRLGTEHHLKNQGTVSLFAEAEEQSFPSLRKVVEEEEKRWIIRALEQTEGNVKQAALLLQIPRQTLQYRLKKMKLSSANFSAH